MKPSVIAMKAWPKRVPFATGERSPYSSRANGSCSASSARMMKAATPTWMTAITPMPVTM